MPAKTTGGKGKKGNTGGMKGEKATEKWGPRADKGEGEAAVQARIATLSEPSRSIMARLHPLVMKHAKALEPTVRYGFSVYMKDKKMVLLAAPRKSYVTFSFTKDAGINAKPMELTSVDQIDEGKVAEMVRRLES